MEPQSEGLFDRLRGYEYTLMIGVYDKQVNMRLNEYLTFDAGIDNSLVLTDENKNGLKFYTCDILSPVPFPFHVLATIAKILKKDERSSAILFFRKADNSDLEMSANMVELFSWLRLIRSELSDI